MWVRRLPLVRLLVLGWVAFIPAVFWGLFFVPVLNSRDALDTQQFVDVAERWWQSQPHRGQSGVVLLPTTPCACGGRRDGLAGVLPETLWQAAGDSALSEAVEAVLPAGVRLDTLVFDAAGSLRLAFDRHDAGHCIDAGRLLASGVPELPHPIVWPGHCGCP